MGQRSRKKKNRRKPEPHPTIFVLDGEIRHYEEGSMLELFTKITPDEWRHITEETVKYKLFLEVLKETAFPILKETWTKEDDWWRLQLEVAISRMRNIDPMAFVTINQEEIKKTYTSQAQVNAEEMVTTIKLLRDTQNAFQNTDPSRNAVSDL